MKALPARQNWIFEIQDWGRMAYPEAWERQKKLVEERAAENICDQLIFCEHEAVLTVGRKSQRGEAPWLDPRGIPVVEVERGGDVTYHGPGQVVAYPIFLLGRTQPPSARNGVHALIRALENWVIEYVRAQDLNAGSVAEKTGVWIEGQRKIASIGIAARRWVSYHGIALNFDTGPDPWQRLRPCNFESKIMTDLKLETQRDYTYAEIVRALSGLANKHFS